MQVLRIFGKWPGVSAEARSIKTIVFSDHA